MGVLVHAPQLIPTTHLKSVFLAGTIDNGSSVDWQEELSQRLRAHDVLILNPRREEWDASWEQSIAHQQFKQQVEWELDGLECADYIFMYFLGKSQSPITLLELGLHARSEKIIIVCEKGFWRRGNIEVLADRYDLLLFDNFEEGVAQLITKL